jgi:hypothetical protein
MDIQEPVFKTEVEEFSQRGNTRRASRDERRTNTQNREGNRGEVPNRDPEVTQAIQNLAGGERE